MYYNKFHMILIDLYKILIYFRFIRIIFCKTMSIYL
nr:MAG TPA: hypothetical protein [Caudoviricetes sp.]